MHSTIKQGYVAPIATQTGVSSLTLGTPTLAGEPSAGYHL
jgi:hypothetical protein